MRYTLSSHSFKVLEATNLQQAGTICSAPETPVHLVILDADAEPGLKWPICHPCAPLPTILSESQAPKSPDDFWQLPFDPEQLLSKVSSALAQSGVVADDRIHDKCNGRLEGNREVNLSSARVEVGGRRAVLIVEDNNLLRHAVATVLRGDGCSVFEAEDGTSAIALFKAHDAEIGLVLLDMTLPGMSGGGVFRVLAQIRPGVKVIVTTAHSQETVKGAIGCRQPLAFVPKPYRIFDLMELIQSAQTQEASQQMAAKTLLN